MAHHEFFNEGFSHELCVNNLSDCPSNVYNSDQKMLAFQNIVLIQMIQITGEKNKKTLVIDSDDSESEHNVEESLSASTEKLTESSILEKKTLQMFLV
ncbi:hypothetical protein TNCV_1176931 [Trichonephila clavipes]|nr:hypothetical protein TNCV_1176931 [Trichonephila clavipes]